LKEAHLFSEGSFSHGKKGTKTAKAEVTGSVDFNELQQVETILNLLHAELKSNFSQYSAGDYGNAVTFIEQLKYEARRPVR